MTDKAMNEMIVRMLAFGNAHPDHREYWHASARNLAEMNRKMQIYKKSHDRYECLRAFHVEDFKQLYETNLKGNITFDSLVDIELERRKK